MNPREEAISDLNYVLESLLLAVRDLPDAALAGAVVDQERGYTIKQELARLVGWQEYILNVLPVMLATINNQLPPVDVRVQEEQALLAGRHKSGPELLAEFEANHRQIVDLLAAAPPQDLTLRRTRQGKVFTIKSYVVDLIQTEVSRVVENIELWRAEQFGAEL